VLTITRLPIEGLIIMSN